MTYLLHQFQFSHFNEKARWALDFKGATHTRRSYLPGPHMGAMRKLSGQTQTPVLQAGDTVVSGSAAIVDFLERSHPQPALYPADVAQRTEALELQQRFDAEVGPAVRTVLFAQLLSDLGYMASMFGRDRGALQRFGYRAMLPLVKGIIARGNGVDDPANVEACIASTAEALDEIALRVKPTGYLVGECFSVADLAVAALLAPIANVEHPDMRRPEPMPAAVSALIAGYAGHPAIAWVREIYARHR